MAPILELIKKNAVPVNVMRSAALGSLPISSDETLEVLVYLTNNSLFGQDARMTLARWDAQSAMDVLSKETTAPEVLLYFWQEQNRRPGLMPTLIENPAIPENLLMELAGDGSREIMNMLLASARARALPSVVEALSANEYVTPAEAEALRSSIAKPVEQKAAPEELADAEETSPEVEAAHKAFEQEHASEIAAEEGKPFELVKEDETPEAGTADPEEAATPVADAPPKEQTPAAAPPDVVVAPALDEFEVEEQKRLTILRRVSKLNVGQRIKLGFIGSREERAILIRDTARLVQNAVLSSPKVTDAEVETFAGSKNLQENVFREIARQRRFIKL
ncbi:MAG TPA: hypothetical protein VNB54_11125, partial [Alphaproteobacteria bacterium]|nr:hypothetical protein [Alphaproteobacteria bacterium]